ncbi:MAG: leucyl/phenylalanyl-tRNA--protein transferase [Verrucomicrobiota bacterium]
MSFALYTLGYYPCRSCLPPLQIRKTIVPILLTSETIPLPAASTADEDGLVAVGGILSSQRLREAYSKGIFPWTEDPVTWWSPPVRAVIPVGEVHISSSLEKRIHSGIFETSIDTDFEQVIRHCAHPHQDDATWIGETFIEAYTKLHREGIAHSVECRVNGTLVGGLYGLAIGGMFAGESMFYHQPDASKVALAALDRHLQQCGFHFIDSQVPNNFTTQMGALTIPRDEYLKQLDRAHCASVTF